MPGYTTKPSDSKHLWRIKFGASFSFRSWGDECIIYNELSGHTHLLDTLAADILFILQEHVLHFHELANKLQEEMNLPDTADLTQYLNKLLPELQKAELLE